MMNHGFSVEECAPGDPLFRDVPGRMDQKSHAAKPAVADETIPVTGLVLLRSGEAIGRVAVYRNAAMRIEGKPVVPLGNFVCIQDVEAAKALLDAALVLARQQGAAFAVGPMDGSTWNTYRFITWPGVEPRFFTEPEHPPHDPGLWQAAGFAPFQEYVSSLAPLLTGDAADVFSSNGLTVRGIRTDMLRQDLELVYPHCMTAFAENPLFTPISKEDFLAKMLPLQPLLTPAFTKIVTDRAGHVVAFILAMPDVLNPENNTLILKTTARHPQCAVHGLMPALYHLVCDEARVAGLLRIIHAFMHVDNASLRRSRQFEGEVIRKYTLFIRPC